MRGIIAIWSGAIVDIPPGWHICDGTAGTPDLTGKFIVGAGDAYAVDEVGGALSHSHRFTADAHGHSLPGGIIIGAGASFDNITTTQNVTGATDLEDNLPPFYALAFIMRE